MKAIRSVGAATATAAGVWTARHGTSAEVRGWRRPRLPGGTVGPLHVRTAGAGDHAVVLLHGLVSTGDVFGAGFEPLAEHARLSIPDLLGFGRSLDETRSSFKVEDHLDALDELADKTGLFDCQWTLGAHSMGSTLGLRWAARHADRVRRMICWGAPVYAGAEAVRAKVSESAMARLFVLDTRWAERACALSCRNRSLSGWLGALVEPALPVPIARKVSLHTWPAYRDAMVDLVINPSWGSLLNAADRNGLELDLIWGSNDRIGDRALAAALTVDHPRTKVSLVPGAGHHLPLTHPGLCLTQLGR